LSAAVSLLPEDRYDGEPSDIDPNLDVADDQTASICPMAGMSAKAASSSTTPAA
jgi:N12 class adenine-specific DNA methylase